jgi:hypothetical protein
MRYWGTAGPRSRKEIKIDLIAMLLAVGLVKLLLSSKDRVNKARKRTP